ncbi:MULTISPECIES: heavy-metal-associated domain-containing protein [Leeia]|uniref:Heavy-metal-associated domain-containing protein n=1 Tax=Leeia aquatica TaxID=2725557 RepID=A0A847RYF6_9NEIS|nr:cation transporter [Leeia aquatica]NLR74751.1 heavy-metal-associated domain-containing protein [Leeia aquatica]
METLILELDGMSCGGCVASVQKILSSQAGVQSATVSLSPQQAEIQFDPAQTGRPQLVKAIEEAGYDVR